MYKIYLTNKYEEPTIEKHNPVTLITFYLKKYLVDKEEDSNIIFHNVYPIDGGYIHRKQRHDKINFFIWNTDDEKPSMANKNTFVFRTSGSSKNKKPTEFGFSWCSPILFKEQLYSIKTSSFEPIYNELSIGFCGAKGGNPEKDVRGKCIDYFLKSELKSNFILRDKFIRAFPKHLQEKYRNIDYIENMKDNIFTLAPRGGGNWSLRLYETMAYGRIPVLYDSNMLLPFDDKIDWKNTIIFGKNCEELEQQIIEWYSKGEDFIKSKQIECRNIWEQYLSMEGFSNNLLDYFVMPK